MSLTNVDLLDTGRRKEEHNSCDDRQQDAGQNEYDGEESHSPLQGDSHGQDGVSGTVTTVKIHRLYDAVLTSHFPYWVVTCGRI